MWMVWKPEQITVLRKQDTVVSNNVSKFKILSLAFKTKMNLPQPTTVCVSVCVCVCVCVCVLVAQSCVTLCNPMDYSPPGSSVHGLLQVRILERVAVPSPGDLPNPETEPRSPALQADSLPPEPGGSHCPLLGPCNSNLLVFLLLLQHAMLLPASKIRHRVFPLPGNCFHSPSNTPLMSSFPGQSQLIS